MNKIQEKMSIVVNHSLGSLHEIVSVGGYKTSLVRHSVLHKFHPNMPEGVCGIRFPNIQYVLPRGNT